MNRALPYIFSPEAVMAAFTIAVFHLCSRIASGEGESAPTFERLLIILPPIAVTMVFLTLLAPNSTHWWWLGRALAVAFIGVGIFSARIIEGFGSGAKGQDAGFIVAIMLTGLAASLGAAVSGAIILAHQRPGFAEWFRARPTTGSALTLLAAIPIGVVLFFVVTLGGALAMQLWVVFRR